MIRRKRCIWFTPNAPPIVCTNHLFN